MLKDKDLSKAIVVSVFSSIIVFYFIEPIISFFAEYFILISEYLSNEWVNSIYKSASLNFREKTSFVVLLISSYFSAIALLIFSGLLLSNNDFFNKSKKQVNDLKIEKSNNFRKLDIFAIFGCVYMFFEIISFFSSSYVEMQVIASFNQRIDAIAYKVDDQEIKNIKSKWANMKTRKDYEEINIYINDIASNKNIEIPMSLWN